MIYAVGRDYLFAQRLEPDHLFLRVNMMLSENVSNQFVKRRFLEIKRAISLHFVCSNVFQHSRQIFKIHSGAGTSFSHRSIAATAVIDLHALKNPGGLWQLESYLAHCLG